MKKRKERRRGDRLRRMMALLLAAALIFCVGGVTPVNVLAEESVSENSPEVTEEEELAEDYEEEDDQKTVVEGQDGESGQKPEEPAEKGVGTETAGETDVQPDAVAASQSVDNGETGAIIPASDTGWTLDENGKLTIESDEGMTDWANNRDTHKDKVKEVVVQDGVKRIVDKAFRLCQNLKSITLPDSVTSIGEYAFFSCKSLTDMEIPDSVSDIGAYAFGTCESLKQIEIPSGVTRIEEHTFAGCKSLTDMKIPDNVSHIGQYAFCVCSNLTSINVPAGVESIEAGTFAQCGSLPGIDLPDSVTSIGSEAFLNCGGLAEIEIPSSVTSIEKTAFRECTGLQQIEIPPGVTSIEEDLFYGCTSLKVIALPDGVTSIGEHAFDGCSSLMSIKLPDSVTSIGNMAFDECSSLKSIIVPAGVESIAPGLFMKCSALEDITLPDGLRSIEEAAFIECTSLTNIEIPDKVKSIGGEAFEGCTSLTGITIPSTVTEIGSMVFYGCTSLTEITIPAGVTEIGCYTFYECTSLTDVTMQGTEPPKLLIVNEETGETGVFTSCKFVEDNTQGITVPPGTLEAYQTAWPEWKDYIVEGSAPVIPTDKEKLDKAMKAVEAALADIQGSNDITRESLAAAMQDVAKAALEEAGIDSKDVTVTVADFAKTEATTEAAGSITADIKITSGTESASVPVSKTIDRLPATPAQKVAAAKAAVEAAVKKAVDAALTGITVTNENAQEIAAQIKGLIPDAVAGALAQEGVSADEVAAGEADIRIDQAEVDREGSITISIPLTSKEDAGQADSAMIRVPVAKADVEDDPGKDAEAAQKMVEDALDQITATNETTKEDILDALKKELGDKAKAEGIDKFDKKDATEDAPGNISLSIRITINGKTVIVNVTVTIAQLTRRNGVYVRFMDHYDMDGTTPRYKYTGLAIKPAVRVYNNEELLTPGTDYTIGYKNNTKVGVAALTVKGRGRFSGTSDVVNFTIINADIEKDTDHSTEMTVVVNTKVTPIIMNGTKKLSTKDYQLEGDGLVSGKYAAATREGNPNTLTVKGIGSYEGSSFAISVRVIERSAARKMSVTVDRNFKPVYNGSALDLSGLIRKTQDGEGVITVTDAKDKTKILKEGTDFTILCTSSLTDAGTVRFTVTGMGEYTGSVNKSFRISPLKVADSSRFSVDFDKNKAYEYRAAGTTVDGLVVTYLGETDSPADDRILRQGTDYKVTYSNHKKVSGTRDAGLKVTFLGNYKGSSAVSETFRVVTAKLSSANTAVIVPDKVYTRGNRAYKSTPIVTVNGAAIRASQYTVSYAWATGSEAEDDTKYVSDDRVKITIAEGDSWAKVRVTVTPKQTASYALAQGAVLTGEYYVRKADGAADLSRARVTFFNKAGTQLKNLEYNGYPYYTPAGNDAETGNAPDDPNAVYVKVTVGGAVVAPDLYDVVWTDATAKGRATVVIRGKGVGAGKGIAVGSKNQSISIRAMALNGKTLQSFLGR